MSSAPPFGLVLPTRPVLFDATTISETQYAFSFSTLPHFSHVVVFLTPGATLPDGLLTGVYIKLPSSPDVKFLGAIGNGKPSAVFKMMNDSNLGAGEVTVGLALEPAERIAAQMETLRTSQLNVVSTRAPQLPMNQITTKILAQRIIKNAYNFLGSFAGSAGPGGVEVVPLKSFQDWWTKFERRVEADPGFLEREQSD